MGKASYGATPVTGQNTVTTTATPLQTAATGAGKGTGRCSSGLVVTALTTNTVTVYVGPSTVTTANGYPLEAGKSISLDVDDPSKLYAVCASSAPVIGWLYL